MIVNLLHPLPFTYVNAHLAQLESLIGFPIDQIRFILCLLIAYPLSYTHSFIHSVTLKHSLNILIGLLIAQFVYQSNYIHSFFSALVTFAILRLDSKHCCTIVFFFNMIFLAYLHLARMYENYMGWDMDSTSSQMILVIKLTSIAYNYKDGQEMRQKTEGMENAKEGKTEEIREKLAIREMPSLLEFLGYVYCFPTFLVGPCFEYQMYKNAMEGNNYFRNEERVSVNVLVPALKKGLTGLSFMALVAVFGKYGDMRAVLAQDLPFLVKILRLYPALILVRSKYYCAWKLAEGATLLSGAGFEGWDENGCVKGYNGVSNIEIVAFETSTNIRDLTRTWNKGTQVWLERYVYNRNHNSLFLTYLCSAVWHGFYPGYYLFFLTVPLATAVNRLSRRHIRPLFLTENGENGPYKVVYDVVGICATMMTITYLSVCFVVLSWEGSIAAYKSLYFSGHIAMIVIYTALSLAATRLSKVKRV